MAGLSRNGCGERDAGLSQEPWQKRRPPGWVRVERGSLVTWRYARGYRGAGTPWTPWALRYTPGRQQAGSFGVRVGALARSLSVHLVAVDRDG